MQASQQATHAIRARRLSVSLGTRPALNNLTFDVGRGRVTALIGPNGAGKSTLLRALCGLLPFSGTIELLGKELGTLDRLERARRVAYVPQRSLLDAALTVREVVELGRYAHRPGLLSLTAEDRTAIASALAQTDVADLAGRRYTQLSGGEQRRVLLARALATGAPLVLLDEPTVFLDVEHSLQFQTLLGELANAGRTLLVAMHSLDEVLRTTHDAILLADGQLVSFGPAHQVVTPELVRRVYHVELVEGGATGFRSLSEPGGSGQA